MKDRTNDHAFCPESAGKKLCASKCTGCLQRRRLRRYLLLLLDLADRAKYLLTESRTRNACEYDPIPNPGHRLARIQTSASYQHTVPLPDLKHRHFAGPGQAKQVGHPTAAKTPETINHGNHNNQRVRVKSSRKQHTRVYTAYSPDPPACPSIYHVWSV